MKGKLECVGESNAAIMTDHNYSWKPKLLNWFEVNDVCRENRANEDSRKRIKVKNLSNYTACTTDLFCVDCHGDLYYSDNFGSKIVSYLLCLEA